MKKLNAFASRNLKEILRDPLNYSFGIGFPIVILFLLTAIQKNAPIPLFEINNLIPGIAVFGLSFIALFSGTLIAKDRSTSFLMRLFTTPLKSSHFILGYVLPLLPLAIIQSLVCFIVAFFLGLTININVLLALVVLIPTAILNIAIGLLCGTIFTDKQVGGVCGALLTNLSAWLSGAWFDLNLVGGLYKDFAYLLPFAHAVDATKKALSGNYGDILPHLIWVIGYATVTMFFAVVIFKKKMKSDKQ